MWTSEKSQVRVGTQIKNIPKNKKIHNIFLKEIKFVNNTYVEIKKKYITEY